LRVHDRLVLIVALALAAPLGEAFFSAISTDLLGTRNLAVSWAGLALLVAALLTAPHGRAAGVATACVIAGFAIGAWKVQETFVKKPDFEGAAGVVDQEAGPRDVVIDASVFSPGPLSGLDVQLTKRHRMLRVGAPQQRVTPFSAFDKILPPPVIASRALREAAGRRIVIATTRAPNGSYGPQVQTIIRRLEPRYEKVSEEVFPAVLDLAVLTFDPRPSARGGEDDVVGADAP
jgi:hypothetical protein